MIVSIMYYLFEIRQWGFNSYDVGILFLLVIPTLLTAFLLSMLIGAACDKEYKEYEKIELVCLNDNINPAGSFFVGCGQIGSELKYFYYHKTIDGGKKNDNISADSTTIFEDENTKPFLIKKQPQFKSHIANWFAINMSEDKNILHIPKNSINTNYTLNNE